MSIVGYYGMMGKENSTNPIAGLANKIWWVDPNDSTFVTKNGDGEYLTIDDKSGDVSTPVPVMNLSNIPATELINLIDVISYDAVIKNIGNTGNTGTSETLPAGDIGFQSTDAFTVAICFKTLEEKVLIGRNNSDAWGCISTYQGKFTFEHYNGGWQAAQSTSLIDDGSPHVCILVNHSDETCDIWVDGVKETTSASSVLSLSRYFKLDRIGQGVSNLAGGQFHTFLQGDIVVFNTDISDTDATTLSNYYINLYNI